MKNIYPRNVILILSKLSLYSLLVAAEGDGHIGILFQGIYAAFYYRRRGIVAAESINSYSHLSSPNIILRNIIQYF